MTRPARRPRRARAGLLPLLAVVAVLGSALPLGPALVRGESPPDHLLVSEVTTGGTSASDEFIELYNPTVAPLPLEGLELVYVSASGLSVSRRAAWDAGAPELPPGGHLLVANESGVYAPIADATYASGMAATGGSVALRIQGGSSAIDAVGWGSASSTWLEGTPAPAPAAGASLERLPGGPLGSTQDTDDNAADYAVRTAPDPQNLASAPTPDPSDPPPPATPLPSASAPPTATPSASATPTPGASASATATPSPSADPAVPVAVARSLPDGTAVTVEATALTGSAFTEGGGYVADASGGIAVLLTGGSFERGALLRIGGTLDDRFSQRTIRADADQVSVLGNGSEPPATATATGAVTEALEGTLARIEGFVSGPPTTLSAGLAFDVDDGSGPVRVVVGTLTGIDTAGWTSGTRLHIVGVVGQRDSSGTGISGYRLQPRDPADVLAVVAPTPTPDASSSPSSSPDPGSSPSPDAAGVISVAEARALPKNARARIRATVTMPAGIVDPVTAVVQDGSGAIVLRVGEEVGRLARGERIEVTGVRSTLAGMETLRVTTPATRLGSGVEPPPAAVRSGEAGESLEAVLVRVRGAVVATARRVASGTVSFELDDGSGPLRISLAAALGADPAGLTAGTWVEVTGILGQETTGAQPLRGYRVWPRAYDEVRILARATGVSDGAGGTAGSSDEGTTSGGEPNPAGSLGAVAAGGDLAGLRIGATIVHGPWPELGVAGLLWDGERLVALATDAEAALTAALAGRRPPMAVEITGLVARGSEPRTGVPVVGIGDPGALDPRGGPGHAPSGVMPRRGASWLSLVGGLVASGDRLRLRAGPTTVVLERLCDDPEPLPEGTVHVLGIALADPPTVLVPCDGILPAPALGRPIVATADIGAPEPAASASGGMGGDEPSVGHALAAGLLGLGALLVAGAGAVARRLDPDGDGPDPEATGQIDERDEEADAAVATSAVPVLTLVSVPRERGSP